MACDTLWHKLRGYVVNGTLLTCQTATLLIIVYILDKTRKEVVISII